jgi:hypothetical protein
MDLDVMTRPSPVAPILAVLAVVLMTLGIYGAAYLALVRRTETPGNFVIIGRTPMRAPEYRVGGAFSGIVFTPAYRLDTTLRPRHWGRRPADPYDVEVYP